MFSVLRANYSGFKKPSYDHLTLEEFKQQISVQVSNPEDLLKVMKPLCPSTFEKYNHDKIKQWKWKSFWRGENQDMDEKEVASNFGLTPGHVWTPTDCKAVHQVTIIVPVRDRPKQLKRFALYIHPFLQLQMVEYRIIVVEQTDQKPFNRGLLFNVGFIESMKKGGTHCYIMHDVDLLPENLQNVYGCTKNPRHMSSSINSHRFE